MWFADRSREGDLFSHYTKMHEISLKSFEKYLAGDWEFVFYQEEVENIQEVFRDHFFKIYNLWKENAPCNILYCGPDNIMMKPTEIFGRYDKFSMFNFTDPKTTRPGREDTNAYNVYHPHYFNADVRYYPAEMSQDTWDIGLQMAENWDFNCWGTEQVILNEMMWKQPGVTLENMLDPKLSYQGFHLFLDNWDQTNHAANLWNGMNAQDAHIIHVAGSRVASKKVELMQVLWEMTNK